MNAKQKRIDRVTMIYKSIQSSLLIVVVAIVAVATIVVVSVSINRQESAFIDTAAIYNKALSASFSIQLKEANEQTVDKIIERFSLFPNIAYAAVLDKQFDIKNQYLSADERENITSFERMIREFSEKQQLGTFTELNYLLTIDNIESTNSSNSIEAQSRYLLLVVDVYTPLHNARTALLKGLMPVLAMITLLVLLTTIWLLNRFTKPLLELCDFTKKVQEEGDYALRINESGGYEFRQLKHHVNRLMDTISDELAKNQQNTKDLLKQQKAMSKLANYDSLTGLPNRQFVMDNLKLDLARAKRSEQNIPLLFFDLDGFKNINDTLGHETGDKLLVAVAERVKGILREADLIARLGGDEFLIVPDRGKAQDDQESIELAKRLLDAFDKPFEIDEADLQVGLSIGIASAKQAGYDLTELISNADIAMYRSKANGRGKYTIFEQEMIGDNKRKLEISNSILSSLEAEQFFLVYQPKINSYGLVTGFEALMRWRHPQLGDVSPSEFIPVAEQGGKIHALTNWLFRTVCSEMAQLLSITSQNMKISVNLSAHDLHNKDLYDLITSTLSEFNVSAANIEIEVTESALLESFSVSNAFFKKISLLGCSIALDDFGTGYSSLSYLTQMRVDKLKIDRQFVLELDSSERSRLVTRTIIDLAKRLDLETCAEGIENQFQQEYLLTYGCNEFQGFYYGIPQPLSQLPTITPDFSGRF